MKHHHYLIFLNIKKKLAKVLFLRAIYRDNSLMFTSVSSLVLIYSCFLSPLMLLLKKFFILLKYS